jgi:hypothetical protein
MSFTFRDFSSDRSFIEATEDDRAILDWMREYREDRGQAQASGDDDAVQELDDLLEFAEDRIVEIKAARIAEVAPKVVPARAEPAPETRRVATAPVVVQRATTQRVREESNGAERPRRRQGNEAADVAASNQLATDQAAAEQAAAERNRRDEEELRELRERARKAEARVKAAQAETARLKAMQQQAAVEQERERRQRAKERAEKEAKAQEKAAAEAEATARNEAAHVLPKVAATPSRPATPVTPVAPIQRRDISTSGARPASGPVELTPIARRFQERLADVVPDAPARVPTAPRVAASGAPTPKGAVRAPQPPPATPAADSVDDLPSLTGADLTSFRNWLAVSQRVLATKLGVEQSTISKGEGRPTIVLPPQLRKALHQAMGEPRPDVGCAS